MLAIVTSTSPEEEDDDDNENKASIESDNASPLSTTTIQPWISDLSITSLSCASSSSSTMEETTKYAYATLLTRDTYFPGVKALLRSLVRVRAQHPLVVMYTAEILSQNAINALEREGCVMKAVIRYIPPLGSHDTSLYKLQLYQECWTKLRMWEMTEYERLVYLDADMVVLHNIDHLFSCDKHVFAAAPDCSYGRESQLERDGCCLFGQSISDEEEKKEGDQKSTKSIQCHSNHAKAPHYFNAGLFVMTPDASMFDQFHSILRCPQLGPHVVQKYAEQDLLNYVYCSDMHWLDWGYNAQKGIKLHHPQLWSKAYNNNSNKKERDTAIKVLHYTDKKPWSDRWHEENKAHRDICDLWWDIYEGKALPYVDASVRG